ncbi:hypothetical protein AOR13_2818 [Alteromonas stellipolaris LMG 21856]|nr:hypothetical protein AOR13_2818 [Alteromonas stellipolaris LMG 21856]
MLRWAFFLENSFLSHQLRHVTLGTATNHGFIILYLHILKKL